MEYDQGDSPVDDLRVERLRRQVEKVRTATEELREEVFDGIGVIEGNYQELAGDEEPAHDRAGHLERAVSEFLETVENNAEDIDVVADLIDPETGGSRETVDPESEEFTELVLFALSEAGEIVAEVEYIESLVTPSGPMMADGGAGGSGGGGGSGSGGGGLLQRVTNWLNGIKSRIISKISQTFWDIVNAHKNARSWTINGEAGFGMLGLSGTVGVGVTFD